MNIEERLSLGRILQELRIQQNYTQEKLAHVSGVSLRTLQRAEKGNGISKENLDALCMIFKKDAALLMKNAKKKAATPPVIRLAMRRISTGKEFLRWLAPKGSLHIGPEGENHFNRQLGEDILGIRSKKDSEHLLHFYNEIGFYIFAARHREKPEAEMGIGILHIPMTLIFAVPHRDNRIRETSKGLILDYIVDRRRQSLNRLVISRMERKKNIIVMPPEMDFDLKEDMIICRSYSEVHITTAMQALKKANRCGEKIPDEFHIYSLISQRMYQKKKRGRE